MKYTSEPRPKRYIRVGADGAPPLQGETFDGMSCVTGGFWSCPFTGQGFFVFPADCQSPRHDGKAMIEKEGVWAMMVAGMYFLSRIGSN